MICVGTGGAIGAISRYVITRWVHDTFISVFPLGTFVVNIIGCFLLGLLVDSLLLKSANHAFLKSAIIPGFIGAFTTFSTFSYETIVLLRDNSFVFAMLNILGNVGFGIASVFLGILTAKLFV